MKKQEQNDPVAKVLNQASEQATKLTGTAWEWVRSKPQLAPICDKIEVLAEHPMAKKVIGCIFESGEKNDARRTLLAKILTSMYFINVWMTNIQVLEDHFDPLIDVVADDCQTFLFYNAGFPFLSIFLIFPVIGLLTNKMPKVLNSTHTSYMFSHPRYLLSVVDGLLADGRHCEG